MEISKEMFLKDSFSIVKRYSSNEPEHCVFGSVEFGRDD